MGLKSNDLSATRIPQMESLAPTHRKVERETKGKMSCVQLLCLVWLLRNIRRSRAVPPSTHIQKNHINESSNTRSDPGRNLGLSNRDLIGNWAGDFPIWTDQPGNWNEKLSNTHEFQLKEGNISIISTFF